MLLESIELRNFRNLAEGRTELCPGLNVFFGDNAQGKTNFLEAVYFSANSRGIRSAKDQELIMFGRDDANIRSQLSRGGLKDRVDIYLTQAGDKNIAVNGVKIKNLGELIQNVFAVVFSPEDLSIVKGGPAERRRYLDVQLCRLSKVYYYDLSSYYKVLKHRNALLKKLRDDRAGADELAVWNEQLVRHGVRIIAERRKTSAALSGMAADIHKKISGHERLEIIYEPNADEEHFAEKLLKTAEKDIALGTTSAGIQRDELIFTIDGTDSRRFASQGQQRTCCLSAILAEAELIRTSTGETPILLLDDVLSELDHSRRSCLFSLIGGAQTILTCTSADELQKSLGASPAGLYEVKAGVVTRV